MNVDRCQLSGRDLALNNFQLKRAGQVREPREHAFLFFTLDLIAHVKLGIG